jgi:hypothetical protein
MATELYGLPGMVAVGAVYFITNALPVRNEQP